MDEQHKPLPLRAMGQQQSHRIRLIEPGQIEEVAVLTERPLAIGVVGGQGGRRDHCRAGAQLIKEALPAAGVNAGIELGHTAAGFS